MFEMFKMFGKCTFIFYWITENSKTPNKKAYNFLNTKIFFLVMMYSLSEWTVQSILVYKTERTKSLEFQFSFTTYSSAVYVKRAAHATLLHYKSASCSKSPEYILLSQLIDFMTATSDWIKNISFAFLACSYSDMLRSQKKSNEELICFFSNQQHDHQQSKFFLTN